jgi:hypothetical protein
LAAREWSKPMPTRVLPCKCGLPVAVLLLPLLAGCPADTLIEGQQLGEF